MPRTSERRIRRHRRLPAGRDRDRDPLIDSTASTSTGTTFRASKGGRWDTCASTHRRAGTRAGSRFACIAQRNFDVVHASNPPDLLLPAVWKLKRSGLAFRLRPSRSRTRALPLALRPRPGPDLSRSARSRTSQLRHRRRRCLDERDVPPDRHRTRWQGPRRRVRRSECPGSARFRAARPNPDLKQGREHLLAYVGVIAPQDGVDYALRALALLRERRTDWRRGVSRLRGCLAGHEAPFPSSSNWRIMSSSPAGRAMSVSARCSQLRTSDLHPTREVLSTTHRR